MTIPFPTLILAKLRILLHISACLTAVAVCQSSRTTSVIANMNQYEDIATRQMFMTAGRALVSITTRPQLATSASILQHGHGTSPAVVAAIITAIGGIFVAIIGRRNK